MSRALLFCCGLLLTLVAGIILGFSAFWYTLEEAHVSETLTRIAGVALIVEGALAAFGAAWCFGRAVSPLTYAPAVSGSAPAAVGGGPVLPICGLLFLLAAFGPLERSQRASRDYEATKEREFRQTMVGVYHDWDVTRSRQLIPIGRTFGVLWLVIGGALLATPLVLKPRVWQLRRRLNGVGRMIAAGGLLLSVMGILAWLVNELANGLGAIGGGRGAHSHDLSVVGYLGLIAGALVAVAGSIIAAAGRSEAEKVRS
jgi:hypothetical protein